MRKSIEKTISSVWRRLSKRIKRAVDSVWRLLFRVSYWNVFPRGGDLPYFSATIGGFRVKSPSLVQLRAAERELSTGRIEHYVKLFSIISRGRKAVVDFGANLGYSTLSFYSAIQKISSRELSSTRFVLVEPNPDTLYLLRQNVAPVHSTAILPLAIGDRNELLSFGIPSDYASRGKDGAKNSGLFSSVGADFIEGSAKLLPVAAFDTLSNWIGPADDVFFAKLDLEGAELGTLMQAESWFDSEVVFQVELNPRYLDVADFSQLDQMSKARKYRILSDSPLSLTSLARVTDVLLVPERLSAGLATELNMTEATLS